MHTIAKKEEVKGNAGRGNPETVNSYRFYLLLLSFIAVLLFAWLCFGQGGLFDLLEIREKEERSKTTLASLEKTNRHLINDIRQLKDDSEYLESIVRKELGLVKENEVVYRLKSKTIFK